jgi:hypothetical protein
MSSIPEGDIWEGEFHKNKLHNFGR